MPEFSDRDINNKTFKCIAADMGAASIRILTGSIHQNKVTYKEIHRFKNEIKQIENHERWDIEYIFNEILKGIKKAINEENNEIVSFGVDSWGVDFVLLDSEGKLLEIPVAYRDSRTSGMELKWSEFMSREETFRRTGINFYVFNTLYQLLSLKDNPILKKTSKILFIPNYIYYRLTGLIFNELTISSTSQLLKVNSSEWDTEILSKCNIQTGTMGKVIFPGRIIGKINHPDLIGSDISAVSVCSHDTASAVAAIPAGKSGFAFISTGTWCIFGVESEKPALSDKALSQGFTNERGINNTYRILKNVIGLWLVQGIQKSLPGNQSFEEIEQWMKSRQFDERIINPEDELFYNPVNMMDAFTEYFRKTGQSIPVHPAEYIHSAYISLGLTFRRCLIQLEELTGQRIEVIHMIGGGCRSEYFNQVTADFCNRPVFSGPIEAAGIGNIIVQGLAMHAIKNIEEGRQIVRQSLNIDEYHSNMDQIKVEKLYKEFIHLVTIK